jgi:hypothetical protein
MQFNAFFVQNYFLFSEKHYNFNISDSKEPCLKFQACNEPAHIIADSHKHMDADILYTFYSEVFKAMAALHDTEEPFNCSSFAPFTTVTAFSKIIDEGEVNGIKQNLQGVTGWDDRGNFKADKTELLVGSHLITSIWN